MEAENKALHEQFQNKDIRTIKAGFLFHRGNILRSFLGTGKFDSKMIKYSLFLSRYSIMTGVH